MWKKNLNLLSVDVFHDRILNDVFMPAWFKVMKYIICYLISLSLFQLSELKEVQTAANSWLLAFQILRNKSS